MKALVLALLLAAAVGGWQQPQPQAAIRLGDNFSSDEVSALERQIAAHPDDDDMEGRAKLLRFYAASPAGDNARLPHVHYLVEQQPGSALAGSPAAFISSRGNASEHRAIAGFWISQASRNPDDPMIVVNAAHFLQVEDMRQAEETLQTHWSPIIPSELGLLYAAGLSNSDAAWAAHSRAALDSSTDASLLLAAARALTSAPMAEYSKALRSRAAALDPALAERQSGPRPLRIGGNVMARNLLSALPPTYPALAAQARVQGKVQFDIVISAEGRVLKAALVSGHPLLVKAALDAVTQNVYKPVLLNGSPVEVVTTVDVPFTLP